MRYRLLAPVGVAGAIALAAWVPTITSASAATPSLAPLSAETLVAKALSSDVKGFSGTVRWTADLGIPSLSSLTSGVGGQGGQSSFDPTSLLSGSHDISVWDAGPSLQRLALPGSLSEVDIVHNGANVYYYDSATQKVTDYTGAAHSGRDAAHQATGAELTPDQAAAKLLAGVGKDARVSVITPVYVAGQAAYQLVVTPDAATSTVGSVTLAIDAANGMALQVQVTPKGARSPALSLGFTTVSFSVPSASTFAAPHGSTTVTKPLSQALDGSGSALGHRPMGSGPTVHVHLGTRSHRQPLTAAQAAAMQQRSAASMQSAADVQSGTAAQPKGGAPAHSTTVGSGWTTIAVLSGFSGQAAYEFAKVSTAVSGSWGSGHLVTSALVNGLELPDGTLLVGLVTPAALEAAAASAAG